jgi:hypothetical protein
MRENKPPGMNVQQNIKYSYLIIGVTQLNLKTAEIEHFIIIRGRLRIGALQGFLF